LDLKDGLLGAKSGLIQQKRFQIKEEQRLYLNYGYKKSARKTLLVNGEVRGILRLFVFTGRCVLSDGWFTFYCTYVPIKQRQLEEAWPRTVTKWLF